MKKKACAICGSSRDVVRIGRYNKNYICRADRDRILTEAIDGDLRIPPYQAITTLRKREFCRRLAEVYLWHDGLIRRTKDILHWQTTERGAKLIGKKARKYK